MSHSHTCIHFSVTSKWNRLKRDDKDLSFYSELLIYFCIIHYLYIHICVISYPIIIIIGPSLGASHRIDEILQDHVKVLVSLDGSDQSSCAFEWALHGFAQSDRETELFIAPFTN